MQVTFFEIFENECKQLGTCLFRSKELDNIFQVSLEVAPKIINNTQRRLKIHSTGISKLL
jgi:hypothetical protein